MVSTRQMATSHSGGGCSGSVVGGGVSAAVDECTRLALVTASLSPAVHTQRGLTQAAGPSANGTAVAAAPPIAVPAPSTCTTRHTHLTQALKACGSSGSIVAATGSSGTADADTNNCNIVTSSITPMSSEPSHLQLLDLPTEILGEILSYVSYKKIGQLRMVSQKMNDVCMHILNMTFSKLITQTYNHFHAIKANMPRRESARRNHPLACECDIIETCYMRLSLLQMTFGKHIERGHCCFFPGAILDEVYTILHYIKITPRLERPYSVTDELFDLSTMAMEYFRDRIEHTLPGIAYFNKDFFKLPTTTNGPPLVISSDLSDNSSNMPSPPQSNMVLRKGIRKIEQGMKIYNNQLSVLRNELRTCKRKSSEQGKQIGEQQKLLAEQQKQTLEYANRLDEMDKKNEEMSRKFSTLLQELNKCKTELQYWRSKSPAMPACSSCGQKMAPVLPPEDYQALINQGVRPEDILLNLHDDELEAGSVADDDDVAVGINESGCILAEFALPDEATTTKLLAVNTAASKNLKRQYQQISNTTSSNINTSTTISSSNGSTSGGGENSSSSSTCAAHATTTPNIVVAAAAAAAAASAIGQKPIEMTNCLAYAKSSHIIRANCSAVGNTHTPSKDLNAAATVAAATTTAGIGSSVQAPTPGNVCYSTKLFYGTPAHKGVIVSPAMLAKATDATATAAAAVVEAVSGNNNNSNNATAVEVVAAAAVNALQAIKTPETKKTRRVQKATRCASGSGTSNSCKRSK